MMTELCQYLRNWFNRKPDGTSYPMYEGLFEIVDGALTGVELAEGQWYRIMGSLFNDGVHKYGEDSLTDETFLGCVWSMGVPPDVESLAQDIADWQAKYGNVDSEAMSPFASESFGGYSYSKQQGYAKAGGGMLTTWQDVFEKRLNMWRKL